MSGQVDMRFGIVRTQAEIQAGEYVPDDQQCPACSTPTVKGDDPTRRYCTSKRCNALIVEGQT